MLIFDATASSPLSHFRRWRLRPRLKVGGRRHDTEDLLLGRRGLLSGDGARLVLELLPVFGDRVPVVAAYEQRLAAGREQDLVILSPAHGLHPEVPQEDLPRVVLRSPGVVRVFPLEVIQHLPDGGVNRAAGAVPGSALRVRGSGNRDPVPLDAAAGGAGAHGAFGILVRLLALRVQRLAALANRVRDGVKARVAQDEARPSLLLLLLLLVLLVVVVATRLAVTHVGWGGGGGGGRVSDAGQRGRTVGKYIFSTSYFIVLVWPFPHTGFQTRS